MPTTFKASSGRGEEKPCDLSLGSCIPVWKASLASRERQIVKPASATLFEVVVALPRCLNHCWLACEDFVEFLRTRFRAIPGALAAFGLAPRSQGVSCSRWSVSGTACAGPKQSFRSSGLSTRFLGVIQAPSDAQDQPCGPSWVRDGFSGSVHRPPLRKVFRLSESARGRLRRLSSWFRFWTSPWQRGQEGAKIPFLAIRGIFAWGMNDVPRELFPRRLNPQQLFSELSAGRKVLGGSFLLVASFSRSG